MRTYNVCALSYIVICQLQSITDDGTVLYYSMLGTGESYDYLNIIH